MLLTRSKTDKKEASMIAHYGCLDKPALGQLPKNHEINLQQQEAILANLHKEHTAVNNQLERFRNSGILDKKVEQLLKKS